MNEMHIVLWRQITMDDLIWAYGTMGIITVGSKWAWLKYAPSSGDPVVIVPIVPNIHFSLVFMVFMPNKPIN